MVYKAITSYVKKSCNHYAFLNGIIFIGFFFLSVSSLHMEGWLRMGVDRLPSSNNIFQPQPRLYNYYYFFVLRTRKPEKKKSLERMKSSNFIWGPKRFSYEESGCAEVHRHSDIYFRCSGDFWFVSKSLVVFCRIICHGSGSGIRKALLHQIQNVLFVLLFNKVIGGICQGISD